MRSFLLVMFAIAGGLTLSGIAANLYRIAVNKPKNGEDTWVYYSVMILAGPSVLFDNATRTFRKRQCTRWAYAFAIGLATYWALILGAIILELVIAV
jgi:hypothetical protein